MGVVGFLNGSVGAVGRTGRAKNFRLAAYGKLQSLDIKERKRAGATKMGETSREKGTQIYYVLVSQRPGENGPKTTSCWCKKSKQRTPEINRPTALYRAVHNKQWFR